MFKREKQLEHWAEASENGHRMMIRAQAELVRLIGYEVLDNVIFVDFNPPEEAA